MNKPTSWDWFCGPVTSFSFVLFMVIPWGGSGAWVGSRTDHLCLLMALLMAAVMGFEVSHLLWKGSRQYD